MARITGYIILDGNDIKKDSLYISGDKNTISLILSLVDPALVEEPKMGSYKDQLKYISRPPKSVRITLGDSEVSKETLISALQFAGIIK